MGLLVRHVLKLGGESKVGPEVVETVSVGVINELPRHSPHKELMHGDSTGRSFCEGVTLALIGSGMPSERKDERRVLIVNEGC